MASQVETETRTKWGADRSAAFDRLMAKFWTRAHELALADEGADLEIMPRISRGVFVEGRFDGDERVR